MDIFTPLYLEGGLLFLLDEYLSSVVDKIRGRGEEDEEIRNIIQTFFPTFRSFSYHNPFRFVSPGEWRVC